MDWTKSTSEVHRTCLDTHISLRVSQPLAPALMADVGNSGVTVCARFRPESDIEREVKGAKAVNFAEARGKDRM